MENKSTNEIVSELIGDTPVSIQLNSVLNIMATKEEVQSLTAELSKLRQEVELLTDLVGDTSVSEQIYAVMQSRG